MLIFRSTKGPNFLEDLILHKRVPELVYLQTRKLLRDTHLERAEHHRKDYWENDSSIFETKVGDNSLNKSSKRAQSVSFNPNLQSMRSDAKVKLSPENDVADPLDESVRLSEERKVSMTEINTHESRDSEMGAGANRLSMSTKLRNELNMGNTNDSRVRSQLLTDNA